MSAQNLFTGVSHVASYAKFRKTASSAVIGRIMDFLKLSMKPPFHQAVDVGCGSGQSTCILSPYFKRVIGIDVSQAQIEEAKKNVQSTNVQYEVGQAEMLPIENKSTQLITSSQTAHWLDLPRFFKEADRVLVPGGILALYCYVLPEPIYKNCSEELKLQLKYMFDIETGKYWHENRKMVEDGYRKIILPYHEQFRDDSIYDSVECTVADVVGYVRSWSAFQTFHKENPELAEMSLDNFQKKFMEIMEKTGPPEECKLVMKWKYCLLMTRKSERNFV